MDTDKHGLIYKDETHKVIGCAFEVLNALGHGLLEKHYENALVVESGLLLNFKHPKLQWERIVL